MSRSHDSNHRRGPAVRAALLVPATVLAVAVAALATTAQAETASGTLAAVQGNAAGVVGFATLTKYGRTGTNGGTGGPTVTVTNYAQLSAAVADDTPRIVRVSGTISGGGDDMLDVGSNKTIIGVGSTATISGFGFDVNGWGPDEVAVGGDTCDAAERDTFTHVENVIIRNLSFRSSPDDSVNVQCYSHHVWVNHNTFYPATDGSVDIKRGSDLVTVSYNRAPGSAAQPGTDRVDHEVRAENPRIFGPNFMINPEWGSAGRAGTGAVGR